MDITSLFIDALTRAGIPPATAIIGDGKLRRYRVEGDSGKQNGWYRLTIDGDLAWGAFGSWKHSVSEKWYNKDKTAYSPVDRERIKARQEQIRQEELAAQKAAAAKAASLWKKATPADKNHPYIMRKGIKPLGVKMLWGKIIVPMYCDGAVVGLQFISDDGTKRFLTGSKKIGCYASISNKGDSRDTINICEGYATSCSVYEATGHPTIAAFDSGNLKHVAEIIRAKYPDAKINLCADNDQYITENRKFNVGLHYGRLAADAIQARLIYPIFADTAGEPKDFNDLHARSGLEAVRDAFKITDPIDNHEIATPALDNQTITPPPSHEMKSDAPAAFMAREEDPEKWKHYLQPGKVVTETEYFPFPYDGKSAYNLLIFLKHFPRWKNMFIYNSFSGDIMMMRHDKWLPGDGKDFKPRTIEPTDVTGLHCNLEHVGLKLPKYTVVDNLELAAKNRTINPPKEFFESIVWDGTARLDTWLAYYIGAESQPLEYLAPVGAKWLIGAVARIYEPGCKFETMLILEGKQGIGKSTALRTLGTLNGQDFFLDSLGDISDKDTKMTTRGKLIIEMAELAGFKKSENEKMKSYISTQYDEYRKPYGTSIIKVPRQFVLAASTNEINEGYLKDETGNRRYWPVKCGAIDNDALKRDQAQLWAEAVVRYKAGEKIYLTVEETAFAFGEQAARMPTEPWQDLIANIVRTEASITLEWLMKAMDLKPKEYNDFARHRIKKSLRALEWKEEAPGYWRPLHALHIVTPEKVETLF